MRNGTDAEYTRTLDEIERPTVRLGPGGDYEWSLDGDQDVEEVLPVSWAICWLAARIWRRIRWVGRGLRWMARHALGWPTAICYHRQLRAAERLLGRMIDRHNQISVRYTELLQARADEAMRELGLDQCEACDLWIDAGDMHLDAEGVVLCNACWEALLAEYPPPAAGAECVNYRPDELPAT